MTPLPAECVELLPGLRQLRPRAHFTHYGKLSDGRLVYRRNCAGIVNQCKALGINPRVQPVDENEVAISGYAFLLPEEEEEWHRMYRNDQPSRSSKRVYSDEAPPTKEVQEDLMEDIFHEVLWDIEFCFEDENEGEVCAPPSEGTECSEDSTLPSSTPGSRTMIDHDNKHDPEKVRNISSEKLPVPWPGGKRTFHGVFSTVPWGGETVYRRITGGIVNWCKANNIDPKVQDGVLCQAWLTEDEMNLRKAFENERKAVAKAPNELAPMGTIVSSEALENSAFKDPWADALNQAGFPPIPLDLKEEAYMTEQRLYAGLGLQAPSSSDMEKAKLARDSFDSLWNLFLKGSLSADCLLLKMGLGVTEQERVRQLLKEEDEREQLRIILAAEALTATEYTDADLDRAEAEFSPRLAARAGLKVADATLLAVKGLGDPALIQFMEDRIASLWKTAYVK